MSYEIEYKEDEYKTIGKKQFFKRFKSNKKDSSPYEKFYKWVAKQLKVKIQDIHVSDIWVGEEDGKTLEGVVKDWLRKKHHLTGKRLKTNLAMHTLDIGPCVFRKKYDWMKKGRVYLRYEVPNSVKFIVTP